VSTSPRRLVSAERREEDAAEASLRPQLLAEFIGQEQAGSNLRVFIETPVPTTLLVIVKAVIE
jgi:Holliday junction DNA helicase RuvB